jgi:hypothetical protein
MKTHICLLAAVASLAACGGGGDDVPAGLADNLSASSTDAQLSAQTSLSASSTTTDGTALRISEVGSNYYSNDIAWLEIYNPDKVPVSLAGYTLRSSYLRPASGETGTAPASFALPAVEVPARGYLVVAARQYDQLLDNAQMIYVRNGDLVPYWNANGSVELVAGDRTVDFVRFGNSTAAPLSDGEWVGPSVTPLPAAPDQHGKAIVRLAASGLADSNRAADWSLVNFATPAGPNDVAPGVVDSDRDGIPDSAKRPGGSYAGLDLYAMGARAGRRDLFLEVDYMKGSDPALAPRAEALQKVVDAFARRNIALHADAGKLHSAGFDPQRFNLGGGNPVDFAACIELNTGTDSSKPGCTSFYAIKSANMDVRRRLVFHYTVFANSQNADGSAGSSGVAELPGNDLIVTLGNYGFSTGNGSGLNMLINLQASTLMHELGHNLGLHHGGNEDANYKPNHYSVMNYMYQFAGLSATPNSINAAERYYLANGMKGKTYCNLVENSPCTADFVIDYSNGSSADLDENRLSEAANIGRGSAPGAYADWDNSGALTAGLIARNLNPQQDGNRGVLKDYDEWGSLQLGFARFFSGANSGSQLSLRAEAEFAKRRHDPMSQHAHNRLVEDALPAALHSTLRNLNYGRGEARRDR